ncbi:lipocalin family protein [Pontibacter sp. MBLB2868]|uniref:lipocalin family protein n=1 Tax=Pontibacter sp. MBLB2868 TaxID=3451555 RepID=UPI003F74F8E1
MNVMNATYKSLKAVYSLLLVAIGTVIMVSCGGKDEVGTEHMISGNSSKAWVINEELNAVGEEEKLTSMEKHETLQFYADGRFAMGSGGMLKTGTWSFDETAKRMSLQFEDEENTENFEVIKLSDDEMELKAEDGAIMKLEMKE